MTFITNTTMPNVNDVVVEGPGVTVGQTAYVLAAVGLKMVASMSQK